MEKKYNVSYSLDVIQRMFDKKQMEEFHEMYLNARSYNFRRREISDTDRKYLEMFKNGKNFSEIARIAHTTDAKVRNAILWAALERA